MKPDQADPKKTAQQILDQAAKDLSRRHAARLEKMTENAEAYYIDRKLPKHRLRHTDRFRHNHLALPVVMASSALFVVWFWWSNWPNTRLQNDPVVANAPPQDAVVPGWVLDTSVPISLLKNSAFYDWLAKQEDAKKHG